ncbi:MAG TPA: HEAT repeat domain-containing protein [Gemmatales bacterium]|nr:HEAT repeat domain-containing protein [Gemmatales bacterium]
MSKSKMFSYTLILTIVASAGVSFWQQNTIAIWYRTWKMHSATPEMLPGYVRSFDAMGLTGTEALVGCFQSTSETACQNARQVLSKIMLAWNPNDQRRTSVLQQIAAMAPHFSTCGQKECIGFLQEMMQNDMANREMQNALSAVIAHASANSESRLGIYEALLQALRNEENIEESLHKQSKSLVIVGIKSDQEAIRLAAIRLAVLPGLQLHEHLLPLVSGQSADLSIEVRQLALLALGEHEKLLATDDLCRFLNDPDKEVRTITERILQVRGLSHNQIKLARLMHDQSVASRAELPGLVLKTPEVDSIQWMERLSKDPAPAVRAATARAIGFSADQRMSTLLRALSEQDQDQTVQQIAGYYLHQ